MLIPGGFLHVKAGKFKERKLEIRQEALAALLAQEWGEPEKFPGALARESIGHRNGVARFIHLWGPFDPQGHIDLVDAITWNQLADFIAEGHLDRHLRRMRRVYAGRASAFVDAARRHWQGLLEVPVPTAGLDIVARLVGMDEQAAMARLGRAGLTANPLQHYVATHACAPGLVLGFAPFDEAAIEDGARRFRAALAD